MQAVAAATARRVALPRLPGNPLEHFPVASRIAWPAAAVLCCANVSVLKTASAPRFRYPYEEFADHIRAMRTVRQWEETSRFGHLGRAQTSRANNARVVEYFADIYDDSREAVHKAELLLSICDYVGRHALLFSRKGLVEINGASLLSVDAGLLRAVHHVFTVKERPQAVDPRKVLNLARAYNDLGPWA